MTVCGSNLTGREGLELRLQYSHPWVEGRCTLDARNDRLLVMELCLFFLFFYFLLLLIIIYLLLIAPTYINDTPGHFKIGQQLDVTNS